MSLDERRFPAIVLDCTGKETELSDERIDDCVGSLGMAENSILCGPIEIRRAMRAVIAADRELRRGDAEMPVVAWLKYDGQDFEYNTVDEFSGGRTGGSAMVKLADAQAALAAKDAEITALKAERDALKVAAKYAEHIDATPENQLQTMLYDTLTERDALRKDAERYRCVRSNPAMLLHLSNEEFDFAVDAAISREKAK